MNIGRCLIGEDLYVGAITVRKQTLPKPHMWRVDGMWACTHSRAIRFGATTYWRRSPREAYVAWLDSVHWTTRELLLSQWRNELKGLS